jgi:hypothetical protein
MSGEVLLTYPLPPAHYVEFQASPTAMQPPDISSLGPTYRVFGQVVENPNHPSSAPTAPPIDRDVIMYDPKKGLKQEIQRLTESLPESVLGLIRGIENNPNQNSHKVLRDFDNRIKSIFHALEALRPVEARESVIRFTEREIEMRRRVNDRVEEILRQFNPN